jgi:enterochelin esterase-like enzyme
LGWALFVGGLASASELEAGATNAVSFEGPVTGAPVRYNIYLPPEYGASEARYPVIYHLHGLDGDEGSDSDAVVKALERAMAAGIVEPMIVVFPNGHGNSMWGDSKSGHKRAETNVIRELVPHVDATYRTRPDAAYRVIQGFSMGGYGAMLYAAKYPELFGICISYDGALHDVETLSTQRESIFEDIFDNDKEYFKDYSPWVHAEENWDALREQVAFRSVVGSLGEFNKKYYAFLLEMDIMQEYVETGLDHVLEAILEQEWEDDYYFIAEHLGGGGESVPLRAGKVNHRVFTGPITGKRVEYNIYLPEDYLDVDTRYPVIYHLHGAEVNQDADDDMVPAGLERAVKAGIVEPMIIVFANGYRGYSGWLDSLDGEMPAETNVIRELIPHIDATYRTRAEGKQRVIQGFSAGGFGAIAYVTKHPELFGACVAYDGYFAPDEELIERLGENQEGQKERILANSPWQNAAKNADAIKANSAIRIISGAFGEMNEAYRDYLKELGISVNYVQTDCGHDMYGMTDAQWKETYTFIAENLDNDDR